MINDKKKFTSTEVDKVIMSTIRMIVNDSTYFYSSTVDSKYSRLTQQGEEFLVKIMNEFLPLVQDVEQDELNERAKDVVLNALKEENNK